MTLHLSEKDVLSALTGVQPDGGGDVRLQKNIFLSENSLSSGPTTDDIEVDDYENTVHYISPATMSSTNISIYEEEPGYNYESPSFMKFLHSYEKDTEVTLTSLVSCDESGLQRTLAIVKPDAVKYENVIIRAIQESGLFILYKRFVHLTPEQVSEIYSQHYGSPAFPHIVVSLSSAPVLCLCLCGINAIEKWKSMIGPSHVINSKWFYPMSMRVRFGLLPNIPDALHASENITESNKENRYVNPEGIIEPLMTEEERVVDFCNAYVNSTLSKGLTEVCRVKPQDPICYLADWLLKNNPYQPQLPDNLVNIPT